MDDATRRLEIIPLVSYTCNHKTGGARHPHRLKELKEMITREFDYTADGFDAEQPVQMATLRWSTLDENGHYHKHSLRMEHHNGDGFKAAKREAFSGRPEGRSRPRRSRRKRRIPAGNRASVTYSRQKSPKRTVTAIPPRRTKSHASSTTSQTGTSSPNLRKTDRPICGSRPMTRKTTAMPKSSPTAMARDFGCGTLPPATTSRSPAPANTVCRARKTR